MMLICPYNDAKLKNSKLLYLALRLSVEETLLWIEHFKDEYSDPPDGPYGFLIEVPFLENVAPPVQVELIASLWHRHSLKKQVDATLLDAAVLFAACETAKRIIADEPEIVRFFLKSGPLRERFRIDSRTLEGLDRLFYCFWDDLDFLSVGDLQDMPPDYVRAMRRQFTISEEEVDLLYRALERAKPSPSTYLHLRGLQTAKEIRQTRRLIATGDPDRNATDGQVVG